MAGKPERDTEAHTRRRIAYEARCSHSRSEMVKELKRMSVSFFSGGANDSTR